MNVRAFFEIEKRKGRSILQNRVLDRTAKATKLGKQPLRQSLRNTEAKVHLKAQQRGLKKVESELIQVNLTELQLDARYTTYSSKEYPTVDKLLKMLRDKNIFHGGRSTHAKVLKTMGFWYKTREDGRQYVYEQPRVIQQWHNYLCRMKRNRVDKRPEVFHVYRSSYSSRYLCP